MTMNITKIVYAAGLVAQKLHKGQTDKGGNDYFESHLLKVASSGIDGKEKVVGFLHDAAEDCGVTVDDVMEMLDAEVSRMAGNPKESRWEEWMEEIAPYRGEITNTLTTDERNEIRTALNLLNHHAAPTREEYIDRHSGNRLAVKVKLHDLGNNMDISRIPSPEEKDYAMLERYKGEYRKLQEILNSEKN